MATKVRRGMATTIAHSMVLPPIKSLRERQKEAAKKAKLKEKKNDKAETG